MLGEGMNEVVDQPLAWSDTTFMQFNGSRRDFRMASYEHSIYEPGSSNALRILQSAKRLTPCE